MSVREFTKKVLKSNPVGRLLYEPIHSAWRAYNNPRRRRALQKHGDETLMFIHKLLTENNIDYYVDWGTLLGIIRENGFIKHDDDIDITIRNSPLTQKEIINLFLSNGYKFVHGFHANGRILEASVIKNRLSIDLFFANNNSTKKDCYELYDCIYDPQANYPTSQANNWRAWFFPKSFISERIQFHNYTIFLPNTPEKLLELEYGKSWHTPIKNFEYKKEELHFEEQPSFAYRVLSINELPD